MNTKHPYRLDANESAFFKRQIEYVRARSYDTKYKQLKSFDLIPVSSEASSGHSEITYRKYTGVGFAKIIDDYANDFPRVDVFGEEATVKIKDIGASYGYSIKEIRSAQIAGVNLSTKRANFARRAVEEKINSIAWNGDASHGINGFLNYPGITEYTVPNGTGGATEWSSKTPDEIVADLSGIVTAVVDPTNGREAPNTMIMPIDQYLYLANTRMTGDSQKSILTYFMENNPFIATIEWVVELKGAGAGASDRFMVYSRSEENVSLEIPILFEQFNPIQKGMSYEIPVHGETAGVIVYYPLAVAYGDGI